MPKSAQAAFSSSHNGYNCETMVASAIPSWPVSALHIQSVDALRGAIMMLMAIDHIRDYIARSAQQFSPTDHHCGQR
jgi:uncharacterized membrane protein